MVSLPDVQPKLPEETKWQRFARLFLERLSLTDGDLSPQQRFAEKALLLKVANAAKLAHHKGATYNGPAVIGDCIYVQLDDRFPGNPCYIQRGVDRKTLRGMTQEQIKAMNAEFAARIAQRERGFTAQAPKTKTVGILGATSPQTREAWQHWGRQVQANRAMTAGSKGAYAE